MSETFEDWCRQAGGNAQLDMEIRMADRQLRKLWSHQQKKIDYLNGVIDQFNFWRKEDAKKIESLKKKLAEAVELIKLSQTRLSTTPCENGLTLGENYTNFLKSLEEKEDVSCSQTANKEE